jgi:uncharacterized protein VirK/YbjX
MSFLSFIAAARRIHREFGFKKTRFFVLRHMIALPASSRWLDFIEARHRLYTGQEAPIEMIRTKFLRSYYNRKLTPARKLAWLCAHYDIEAASLHPASIAHFMRGQPLQLASLTDRSGQIYNLTLHRHERYRAEGELTLFLRAEDEDDALAALSFHLGYGEDGRRVMRIGGLQGPAGDSAKQRIIATTRALSGWRPKALALYAAGVVATLFEVERMRAVPDACHPLRNTRHAFVANNDAFWLENGAGHSSDGDFDWPPLRPETRSLDEIMPKKRKDWLARQALKRSVERQIVQTFVPLLLSPPAVADMDAA